MNDLVNIKIDPCGEGSHLFNSGVPTMNPNYLTFKNKEVLVPAGTIEAGKWYWLNGEFSNVYHTSKIDNAPAISSYMTATYLAIRTKGGSKETYCETPISKVN
jgi:hypothetical protein